MSDKQDMFALRFECPVKLEEMERTGSVYDCTECNCHVYDLSPLSRAEAEAFVRFHKERKQDVCIGYRKGKDGEVEFQEDEPDEELAILWHEVKTVMLVVTLITSPMTYWPMVKATCSVVQERVGLVSVEEERAKLSWNQAMFEEIDQEYAFAYERLNQHAPSLLKMMSSHVERKFEAADDGVTLNGVVF